MGVHKLSAYAEGLRSLDQPTPECTFRVNVPETKLSAVVRWVARDECLGFYDITRSATHVLQVSFSDENAAVEFKLRFV